MTTAARWIVIAMVLGAWSAGCGGGGGGSGEGNGSEGEQGSPPPSGLQIDVVFIVDQQSGAAPDIQFLQSEFGLLDQSLAAAGHDMRYGLITHLDNFVFLGPDVEPGSVFGDPTGRMRSLTTSGSVVAPGSPHRAAAVGLEQVNFRPGAIRVAVFVHSFPEADQDAQHAAELKLRELGVALGLISRNGLIGYQPSLQLFTLIDGTAQDDDPFSRTPMFANQSTTTLAAEVGAWFETFNNGPHSAVGLRPHSPDDDLDGHLSASVIFPASFFTPPGGVPLTLANGSFLLGDDCDDADPTIHPGAFDPLGDGIDQDCDGVDG